MAIQPKSKVDFERIKKQVEILFKSKPSNDWLVFGEQHDVCLTPILSIDELENNPQLKEREMVVEHDYGKAGKLKSIGVPLKFSKTKAQPSWPAPKLGEDNAAILEELGHS